MMNRREWLGGAAAGGMMLSPLKVVEDGYDGKERGEGQSTNPTLNRLYGTLLHAAGAPREHFNLPLVNLDKSGPLPELLTR